MPWRDERCYNYYNTMSLFKDVIDSALPGNESTSENQIPEYMVDFYDESNLTDEWLQTPDHVKKFMLDAELNQYMQQPYMKSWF